MTATEPAHPSRRSVLRLGAGGAGAAAVAASGALAAPGAAAARLAVPAAAEAAGEAEVLVVVGLRGGADGLSLVPPIGDDAYVRARPTIAVPAAAAHRVDDTFRLHPALAPLVPLWEARRLAAVHAVGVPDGTRSHAAATEALERAGGAGGWAARAVDALGATAPLAGVHVGGAVLPTALTGSRPGFALTTPAATANAVPDTLVPAAGWPRALAQLGADAAPLSAALAAGAALAPLRTGSGTALPAAYPPTPLGRALHDVARLVRAGQGLRIATVDDEGWDLHEDQGTAGAGPLADRIGNLARALLGFARELGPDLDRVTVVVLSEFGRRIAENGAGGTDHGHGGAALLLGGGVRGGRVHGRWPGLGGERSGPHEGDVPVTTDVRQLLAELLVRRCGLTTVTGVFPGLVPAAVEVVDPR